jgi:hypothetical protein
MDHCGLFAHLCAAGLNPGVERLLLRMSTGGVGRTRPSIKAGAVAPAHRRDAPAIERAL